jgi:hypothetical protein
MWLKTPESIENVIWEAPMEPLSSDIVERLIRKNRSRGIILTSEDLRNGLPIVSIGSPEIWDLATLYSPDNLPQFLKVKLNESDFYIVRFSCSFRRLPIGKEIAWARFIVQIYPSALSA